MAIPPLDHELSWILWRLANEKASRRNGAGPKNKELLADIVRVMLETERLILREWRDSDLDAIASQNADPRVMAFFPSIRSREETARMMVVQNLSVQQHGFGFVACEHKSTGALLGITGLAWLNFDAEFGPVVEAGWRLGAKYWGQGYASEAGRAWLDYGFGQKSLKRIVAITAIDNKPSIAVMKRIGMNEVKGGEFDHPGVPEASRLRRHVLYEAKA